MKLEIKMQNDYSIGMRDDREKVEIFFSARNLKNKDTMSKTDPIMYVFTKSTPDG